MLSDHVDPRAPNRAEFIPLASVVWQRTEVDISGCATLSDAHDAIMRELFALNGQAQCEEMVERITLAGSTPLHAVLQTPVFSTICARR